MPEVPPARSDDSLLPVLLQALTHVDEVLWIRDLVEERLLYISPGFERIWGRSVEALMRNPRVWIESVHPDDRDRVMAAALNNARTGKDAMEYRIVRPDGKVRLVSDRSYPIRDSHGDIVRLAGIVEDITDRG